MSTEIFIESWDLHHCPYGMPVLQAVASSSVPWYWPRPSALMSSFLCPPLPLKILRFFFETFLNCWLLHHLLFLTVGSFICWVCYLSFTELDVLGTLKFSFLKLFFLIISNTCIGIGIDIYPENPEQSLGRLDTQASLSIQSGPQSLLCWVAPPTTSAITLGTISVLTPTFNSKNIFPILTFIQAAQLQPKDFGAMGIWTWIHWLSQLHCQSP